MWVRNMFAKRLVGVALTGEAGYKACTLILKAMADVARSLKQGCQWPQKGLISSKVFVTKNLQRYSDDHDELKLGAYMDRRIPLPSYGIYVFYPYFLSSYVKKETIEYI